MIQGYKCFNKDLTNNYGFKFEIGKSYHMDGEIRAGTSGNGFHMCEKIEDTFRFYDTMNPDVRVCEVIGKGEIVSFFDEYYGYYNMYSVEEIEIVREINRDEIIQMALNFNEMRVTRFVQVYKLSSDEIELFEEKFAKYLDVINAIAYYQKGKLDVYGFRNRENVRKKTVR